MVCTRRGVHRIFCGGGGRNMKMYNELSYISVSLSMIYICTPIVTVMNDNVYQIIIYRLKCIIYTK